MEYVIVVVVIVCVIIVIVISGVVIIFIIIVIVVIVVIVIVVIVTMIEWEVLTGMATMTLASLGAGVRSYAPRRRREIPTAGDSPLAMTAEEAPGRPAAAATPDTQIHNAGLMRTCSEDLEVIDEEGLLDYEADEEAMRAMDAEHARRAAALGQLQPRQRAARAGG